MLASDETAEPKGQIVWGAFEGEQTWEKCKHILRGVALARVSSVHFFLLPSIHGDERVVLVVLRDWRFGRHRGDATGFCLSTRS